MNNISVYLVNILLGIILIPPVTIAVGAITMVAAGFWWACCEVIIGVVKDVYEGVKGLK